MSFDLFLLFVRWIEEKPNYYKINFGYTSTFKFCYNIILLLFCRFGVQNLKLCIFCWYIYVFPSKTHSAGYRDHIAVVFILTAPFKETWLSLPQHSDHWKTEEYQGSAHRGEVDLDSDVNRLASDKLRQSTTVTSQCGWSPYPWTCCILYFYRWYNF